ncbi:MAG: hypothetical protein Q7T24_00445, partial [Deltaproteobacteria bacterium]|nr:hypothetical protein [Deltaproteobacteria bacterium]
MGGGYGKRPRKSVALVLMRSGYMDIKEIISGPWGRRLNKPHFLCHMLSRSFLSPSSFFFMSLVTAAPSAESEITVGVRSIISSVLL